MENERKSASKLFNRIGMSLFIMALLTLVFAVILIIIGGINNKLNFGDGYMLLTWFFPVYSGILICFLFMKRIPVEQCKTTKLKVSDFISLLFICFAIGWGESFIANLRECNIKCVSYR